MNAIAKSFCRKLLLRPKYINRDLEVLLNLKEIIVSKDATYELVRDISPWLKAVLQCETSKMILGRKVIGEMESLVVIRAPEYGDYQCILYPVDIIYFCLLNMKSKCMLKV